jgi:thiosulfate dehydrogenase [quinone] large subunit
MVSTRVYTEVTNVSAVVDVRGRQLSEPRLVTALFNDTRFSVLWLAVRLYLGYVWLNSGWGKFNNPAWMVDGKSLAGYWAGAVATQPTPRITYDWYRGFIQMLIDGGHHVWFAKLVVYGELAVGVALILGAFVGVAAFFSMFMNFNFMLAGTVSTNPVLFALGALLLIAWKVAGHIGADFVILRRVGTPWRSEAGSPQLNVERRAQPTGQ